MFLLPAIFESENTNQVKNQYAEIVDQRSYKSIFYKQQIKQTNTTGVENLIIIEKMKTKERRQARLYSTAINVFSIEK